MFQYLKKTGKETVDKFFGQSHIFGTRQVPVDVRDSPSKKVMFWQICR